MALCRPCLGIRFHLFLSRLNNFIDYVSGVWNFKSQADVILIDGRFRVACFLYSLIHSKKDSIIIFDDYFDRPWYHIVEEVVCLNDKCGRQAFFKVPKVYDKKFNILAQT